MIQAELDGCVAKATGESVATIKQRGFSVADPDEVNFDPEPDNLPPQVVDWDALEQRRRSPVAC